MNKIVVIVAGGSGSRMKSMVPKQFIVVGGQPVLMHTIRQFQKAVADIDIVVVLPHDQITYWNELIQEYKFDISHKVVEGGKSRFQSVKNGLLSIDSKEGVVAIHDGVRPFVSIDIINKSFDVAQAQGCAIVSMPLKDSLREIKSDGGNEAKERSSYRIIQTPQTFRLATLLEAFDTEELALFTDDATVYEHAGHEIILIDGDYRNIKLTTPEDLVIADVFLKQ